MGESSDFELSWVQTRRKGLRIAHKFPVSSFFQIGSIPIHSVFYLILYGMAPIRAFLLKFSFDSSRCHLQL